MHQGFGEAVDGLGELVGDGSDADPQEVGGFGVGVFLEDDAADDLPVEGGEALEAALDIEDEDESVFEGADAAAGDPAAAYGFPKKVGRTAHLHGGIEVAAKQAFGVFAVKREGDRGFFQDFGDLFEMRLRFGQWLADVMYGRGQELGLQGCRSGCGSPYQGELQGGAHWSPPERAETDEAATDETGPDETGSDKTAPEASSAKGISVGAEAALCVPGFDMG